MKSTNMFLIIFLIIRIAIITAIYNRVKVSIYYETLCPYCINFINNKFYPHYKEFKDYIRMDFIPYAKANGNWSLCQHGNDHCKSIKFQACALDEGERQEKNVEFITCVLSLSYPAHTPGIENCAHRNAFDWESIMKCFNNSRGDDLLVNLRRRANNLSPKLNQVPTIVYNDHFDGFLCNLALKDFVKATCSVIPDVKPNICSGH